MDDCLAILNLFGGRKKVETIQIREFLNNIDITLWLPPFDVTLLNDKNTFKFARNHFIAETRNLLKILTDVGDKKLLVWYAYTHLPSQIKLDLSIHSDITVVDDLASLPQGQRRTFDAAIIVGMPRDFKNIDASVNSVIKENGIVFVIPPDDLLSYMLMWSEFSLARELPGRRLLPVSETNLLSGWFSRLRQSINGKRTPMLHIPRWGTVSNDQIKLCYVSSGLEKMVDRDLIPFNFYPGKIHFEGEKKYFAEITSVGSEGEIRLSTPGLDYAASTPILNHQVVSSEVHGRERKFFFGSVCVIEGKIDIQQDGFILFHDYAQAARNQTSFGEPHRFSKYLKGIRIRTDHFREYDHMLKNFMPLLFPDPFQLFFVITDPEMKGIFIFPHMAMLFQFVEKLFCLDADSTFRSLFQFAYKALLNCPCADGCSKCLYYAFHQEQGGLDKDAFGTFLAGTYGAEENQNYANLIDFRKGRIVDLAKLTNFYNGIKNRTLSILKANLDVAIKAPVPLQAVKDLGGGVLGTYDGKCVKVIPLPELQAIQVISHEYIHNWEDEVGILARGDKFISEGAAQWLSTKVLNYYYQIDEIEADIMGTSADHLREYFNGFQFLQDVDRIYGYTTILQALIANDWTSEQIEIRRRWEEYHPSGAEIPKKPFGKPNENQKNPTKRSKKCKP
jgi:hypothetical protein